MRTRSLFGTWQSWYKMAATTLKKRNVAKNNKQDEVTDEDRQPGVVYIGHVPHGFYEKQLFQYFSQFGKVLAVKLSRSKRNGKSKGYAFVKFRFAAVAKTVAETCHNYLFFNKLLKCEYKPLSEVHSDTFFTFKWKANTKRKRQHNSAKKETSLENSLKNSTRKQKSKLAKLTEFGINLKLDDVMDVPDIPAKPQPKRQKVEKSSTEDVTAETVKPPPGKRAKTLKNSTDIQSKVSDKKINAENVKTKSTLTGDTQKKSLKRKRSVKKK